MKQQSILALGAVAAILHPALMNCAFATNATGDSNSSLQGERAQNDKAEAVKKRPLQGSLEQTESTGQDSRAASASSKPFLQGEVSKSLPHSWNGNWHGGVKLDHIDLNASKDVQEEQNVEMNLGLETAKSGEKHFDLKVRQLAGEITHQKIATGAPRDKSDETPDIHYWHEGNVDHLLLSGGSMTVNGSMIIGGAPGQLPHKTRRHGQPGTADDSGTTSGDSGGASDTSGVNYNNGSIRTTGTTTFTGKYFKSDDRIDMKNTQIHADRIDIGNSTTYTGGSGAYATGTSHSGILLSKLSGGSTFLTPKQISGNAPSPPIELFNSTTQTKVVRIEPGVYDVKATTKLKGPSGPVGTQQVIMRLTEFSTDTFMMQMRINNFDSHENQIDSFITSGYIRRQ